MRDCPHIDPLIPGAGPHPLDPDWQICFAFRKDDGYNVEMIDSKRAGDMLPIAHPGRLLKREIEARGLSATRLALDLGVPLGRITDILSGRRGITADTAVRLGRYLGNRPQFWLDLQSQHEAALVECQRGDSRQIGTLCDPADQV